jgi:uncharacterized small protein (DUF1192 family)
MSDYIPSPDDAFRTFAENFAANITAAPGAYMLTAAQAASIQGVVDVFVAKLAIAGNELTRTKATVADKDDARSVAETMIRQYAIDIKNNEGIPDGEKLAIGVRPINPNREPIAAPTSQPLLNVLGNLPGVQSLRFADSNTPDSRAKPFGATELQLYVGIGETEALPLADCQFYGKITRNPVEVAFTEADDGKIATYYARWATAKGEVGPWSVPVSFRIAA